MKLEILVSESIEELEVMVNAWFTTHLGFQINNISFSGCNAYIIYTLK